MPDEPSGVVAVVALIALNVAALTLFVIGAWTVGTWVAAWLGG